MAREHARVKLSIWEDDDFRALSPAAQHLYFVLMTSMKLDYCGVTDWRPGRIAKLAGGWAGRAVEIAAQELSERLYLIIDTESEEVLIRSFIRSDGLMEQPNLAVAMRKAHAAIASGALRAIVVHELNRLRKDHPDLKGWAKASELLDRPSLDPSEHPSFTPSDDPSGSPSVDPNTNPSDDPSVTGCLTTAPTPAPTPATPTGTTQRNKLEEERNETLQPASATKPPTCLTHPNGDSDGPCGGCARVRNYRDRIEEQHRRAEAARVAACPECEGTHFVLDADKKPTSRKCDHRRSA